MWAVSWRNFRPPLIRVRLPEGALIEIEPSTVYTTPVHTWGVVMTQFPTMAEPAWSHVCAAAGGAKRDRTPTRLPIAVRATVTTLKAIRASEARRVIAHTSEGPPRGLQPGAGGLRLLGHSSLAMKGV